MKVLYVEDDPSDIDFTRRELTSSAPNINLIVAKSLREARERLVEAEGNFDIALLDLHLPDGSGFDLLKEIRKQYQSLAVVILTGVGDEETAVTSLKAGAVDYLSKHKNYLARLPLILEEAYNRFHSELNRRSRPLQILYAEHHAADIDLTRVHLTRYAPHIQLDVAHTGAEAVQRLIEQSNTDTPYDVLLADYHLPAMNGLELIKVLYQDHKLDVPIVIVTGRGNEETAVLALQLGATNYLVKNPGYLFKLPSLIESAFFNHQLEIEQTRLANSEKLFRLLAENARDVIFRFRIKPTPGYEYVSPSVNSVLGYHPEAFYDDLELINKLIHPDDQATFFQLIANNYNEENIVLRFVRKDGAVVWVEQHIIRFFDEQNELVAIEGIARDITPRQKALDALQASEIAEREQRQFAEALRDTAFALISAVDLESVMNTILENVFRVVPHDAANIMLIKNDHASPAYWRGYNPYKTAYIEEISFPVMETPNLREMFLTLSPFLASDTDEYIHWVYVPQTEWVKSYVAAPIRSHGQVIGFLSLDSGEAGFFTETHAQRLQVFADQASVAIEHAQLYERIQRHSEELEQRVAERTAELQRSEARYRGLIESQTDLVCRYLPGGILTFVNQTYCEHHNQVPEQLLGKSRFDLVPEHERTKLEQHITLLNDQNPVASIEIQQISSEGQIRWVHWYDRMLFDDNGQFVEYQGVGRDVTDRKNAEVQLQQMLEHAMELSELRSRYIAMAAHDLRNPLTVIQSSMSTIQHYQDRLSMERIQAKYDQIQNSITVMVNMLDDVLTIGRVESGKLEFSPSHIDITAFCKAILEEVKQFTNTSHQIDFSSHGECGNALLDTKLLRHILTNLLSNAIKYSPDNSVVEFSLACEPDQVIVQIKDHGIGIPQNDQFKLFEAFHRATNARTISGTGLGLAIVKQSVDLHGGTITFTSQENVGTTFTITFPQN